MNETKILLHNVQELSKLWYKYEKNEEVRQRLYTMSEYNSSLTK